MPPTNASAPTKCPPPLRQHLESMGCDPHHIEAAERAGIDWGKWLPKLIQLLPILISLFGDQQPVQGQPKP